MPIHSMVRATGWWVTSRVGIRNERGATAVEYAVMIALIAAVIVVAVLLLGRATSSTFSQTDACISARQIDPCRG